MMYKEMTIMQFLAKLANASGDEALDLVGEWQCGGLVVGGISLDDAEEFEAK
jgi:hypothetical protein